MKAYPIHSEVRMKAKACAARAARPYGGANHQQLRELTDEFLARIVSRLERKHAERGNQ